MLVSGSVLLLIIVIWDRRESGWIMGYREICTNDVYIYIYIFIYNIKYMYISMGMCEKAGPFKGWYIYIYVYMYIYIYIYLHIHMYSLVALSQIWIIQDCDYYILFETHNGWTKLEIVPATLRHCYIAQTYPTSGWCDGCDFFPY